MCFHSVSVCLGSWQNPTVARPSNSTTSNGNDIIITRKNSINITMNSNNSTSNRNSSNNKSRRSPSVSARECMKAMGRFAALVSRQLKSVSFESHTDCECLHLGHVYTNLKYPPLPDLKLLNCSARELSNQALHAVRLQASVLLSFHIFSGPSGQLHAMLYHAAPYF